MKIILTPKSTDKDFSKVVIDGFVNKEFSGINDELTEEIALDVQKLLLKHFLWIDVRKENE